MSWWEGRPLRGDALPSSAARFACSCSLAMLALASCADARIVSCDGAADPRCRHDAAAPYRIEGEAVLGVLRGDPDADVTEYELACSGGLVVGDEGRVERLYDYPYAVAFSCARLGEDGSLEPAARIGPIGVGCGGDVSVQWTDGCPAGEVAVGLHGTVVNAGTSLIVGSLGLTCATLDAWTTDASGARLVAARGADSRAEHERFDDRCDPGSVLTGVSGGAGCAIDSIRIACTRVVR